jgi:hypothetical protein
MPLLFFKLFLLAFILGACTVKVSPPSENNALSRLLSSLNSSIPKVQSHALAKEIYAQTQRLSKEFHLTSPPQYHNFLVNIGIKEKGLCYDWSDALYLHLKHQNYFAFDFHLMGANIGDYWREHNVLLIVAKGKPIDTGIIIDSWRYSGKVYFAKLKEDRKYFWIHRKKRCQRLF